MKNKLLIFTATYNEAENITKLIELLLALNLDAQILIVDDNSPDGTSDIVESLSKIHHSVKLIKRPAKLGIGSAHTTAIKYAYENGFTTLITMDADFSHQPSDIPRFIEKSKDFDVVLGSRFSSADSLGEWNALRKCITHLGHFLTKNLLDMPYDASGALRLYKLNVVPKTLFDSLKSQNYEFFFDSLLAIHINGFSIGEVEVKLPARTYGHSKMQLKHIISGVYNLFALSIKLSLQKKSLLINSPNKKLD